MWTAKTHNPLVVIMNPTTRDYDLIFVTIIIIIIVVIIIMDFPASVSIPLKKQ